MCVFVVLSSRTLLHRERERETKKNDENDERFRMRHLRFFLSSSSRDKEFLDDDDICVSCDPKRDKECREDVLCDVVLCCVRGPPFRRRPSRRAVALFDGVQIAEISAFSRHESPRRRGHAGVSERADATHGECVPDTRGSV